MFLEVSWIAVRLLRFATSAKLAPRMSGVSKLPVRAGFLELMGQASRGLTPEVRRLGSALSVSRLFRHKLLIISSGEQAIEFARIFQRELHHPGPVGIRIHLLGRGRQFCIDLGHGA
jgi:hypothetical protein